MSLLLLGHSVATLAAPAATSTDYSVVHELFAAHCVDCHAAQEPEGKLVLESFESLMRGGETGPALKPGKSADSLLVRMLDGSYSKDGKKVIMPPGKRKKLSREEIAIIKGWIDAGAKPPAAPVKLVRELNLPKIPPTAAPRRSIQAIAFAPGPKFLAVARYGEVELISSETRAVVRTLKGHRGAVNALAFTADGKSLAAAAGEPAQFGEVRVWNTADGKLVRTIEGHGDALYSVAISPDGRTLATGSYDQKIKLWELATGKELHTLSAHNGAIFDLAFRPDGKILASASADRTVKLWSVPTGKRVETLSQPLKEQHALAWSADGKRLAAAGVDNRIRVWDISESAAETTNPLLLAKFAHEGAILNLAWSPDGKTLLSTADDRTLKLWDAAQLTEKRAFETQPDVTHAIAFLADASRFAVGRQDGSVDFYEAANPTRLPPPAPELKSLSPRGLWHGLPTRLRLAGANFLGATNLVVADSRLRVITFAVKSATEIEALVEADVRLPRAGYDISVRGPGGESTKFKLHVDDVAQLDESAVTNLNRLPVAIWGSIDSPGARDEFTFDGRAGQLLVLELATKQLGAKFPNAIVTLLDAAGTTLASDNGFDSGDRLVAFRLPADGTYRARVADQMLTASKDHFYRLAIGELPVVSGVFPLSVRTNSEATLELSGHNLRDHTTARITARDTGELDVPLDPHVRAQRAFKILVRPEAHALEVEPNNQPGEATPVPFPATAAGRINAPGDADLFRFEARAGEALVLETDAARRSSPVDTRIEVLHGDGRPVARLKLQAVRNTAINFRAVDSIATGMRLDNYEEMELTEYLYMNGDVMRLFRMPQGPDSDMIMFASTSGKRRAYFDTTAVAHALDEQGFIVEPHPLDAKVPANGLPVFTLHFENDDDGERKLGSDSHILFTAPTNGAYLVRVTDTRGHGGADFSYRLVLRAAAPDFSVNLAGAGPTVAPDSGQSFTLTAERRDGFDGDIRVDIAGLPPGFTASTPVVIAAGHFEAKGALHASSDAKEPFPATTAAIRLTATATIASGVVTQAVNTLGLIKLGKAPKLYVALEPNTDRTTNGALSAAPVAQRLELTIAPGETIPAWLRIKRNGHDDLVTFFAENLPHGVIVADIGLNGVLIPKGESEREIFFNAARWVPDQDRLFYMIEQQAGRQTSRPVLLKVRRPSASAASSAP